MILKNVTLEKTDTCLTFALKRIGLSPTLCTYDTFHEHFDQVAYTRKHKKLEIGDILLWDKDVKHRSLPWHINENGVIWRMVPTGFHFGVYEGEGYFSDTSRTEIPPYPIVRMRHLNDIKKNPDWVLRYNPDKGE